MAKLNPQNPHLTVTLGAKLKHRLVRVCKRLNCTAVELIRRAIRREDEGR